MQFGNEFGNVAERDWEIESSLKGFYCDDLKAFH